MSNVSQQQYREILVSLTQGVLTITFNRPHKKNAMNLALVNEVMAVFSDIADDTSVRAVVICGSEGNFCAGGDISDMHSEASNKETKQQAIWHFNRSFGRMITQVNHAPQVVITQLEGAVLGGGLGLACVSDIAIAHQGAVFAMPETGLGVVPAQIAPFVVTRIGLTQARRLALLGERVGAAQSQALGIVHFVCESQEALQAQLNEVLKQVQRGAPQANANTKALMLKVGTVELETLLDEAAALFNQALASDEGKEGTQAFMQKRNPSWCE
ncbi:MAG: enoyl-CoA hydratase [Alteromonadaceae bacterium]|uniref:enoyl-CoA hydratase/isomerase family protein n=1 Tax=Paraglaciecola chathamensis TaxID=368405 RepID=UPI000C3A097D|nr:enoyl-CoA hydratase-related protein [Paraglaciecola agarilytica]MBN23718.1 enoyl-CoA hydratase [Alteromonadaceae bacterium]|tara:strand:- start:28342 stop:29154 length:813 start_codon:yes stop_codon:yes gene_type:complete